MLQTSWETLLQQMAVCEACALAQTRTTIVPGEGNPEAALLFIGEGPGADEDRLARPFVGAAGGLLTQMIEAIGLTRDDVYIANVVKCRPPGNRVPFPEEAAACLPFLRGQTALIHPKVICLLGGTALRYILGPEFRITRDRGQFYERKGVFILPTFHPAALLRDESKKRPAWQDFKALRAKLQELGAWPEKSEADPAPTPSETPQESQPPIESQEPIDETLRGTLLVQPWQPREEIQLS